MKQKSSWQITNVFSVDIEEYFNVETFSRYFKREEWDKYPRRVVENTGRLLDILDEYEVSATFFILGWIAKMYPRLIEEIQRRGHEVASHGLDHRMIHVMSRDDFRQDIRQAKDWLEEITGNEILGYRAPTFSIVRETSWAYDILLEEGYHYSSSVYPIWHDRYGWPSFGLDPRRVAGSGSHELWEIPMSVGRLGPIRIPFGGGGYLRAYPLFITKMLFRSIIKNDRPGIVYIHPWELDDNHPHVRAPLIARTRHFQGIGGMERKLKGILELFEFDTMANFLKQQRDRGLMNN